MIVYNGEVYCENAWMTTAMIAALTLVTLCNATQIEPILFVKSSKVTKVTAVTFAVAYGFLGTLYQCEYRLIIQN